MNQAAFSRSKGSDKAAVPFRAHHADQPSVLTFRHKMLLHRQREFMGLFSAAGALLQVPCCSSQDGDVMCEMHVLNAYEGLG